MLDGRPLPTVPTRGQGGAGEILSLSHLFGALAQSAPVAEKDVISLINGSPAASALVADAALAAGARLPLAVEIFALAAEAFNTPLTHFDPALGELWNMPHDAWALAQLNAALGAGHGGARRPYQAPVSFRILPRMLGQARRGQLLAAEVAGDFARRRHRQSRPAAAGCRASRRAHHQHRRLSQSPRRDGDGRGHRGQCQSDRAGRAHGGQAARRACLAAGRPVRTGRDGGLSRLPAHGDHRI